MALHGGVSFLSLVYTSFNSPRQLRALPLEEAQPPVNANPLVWFGEPA